MALVSRLIPWRERVAALPLESFDRRRHGVFAEGTKTGRLLVLKSGAVSISKSGTEIARVAAPGAVLGELSALLDLPHTAGCACAGAVAISCRLTRQIAGRSGGAFCSVASVLAERVVGANSALLELKQQIRAGAPPSLLDKTADKIVGMLSAIGSGYLRAGAGMTGYPFQ